MLRYHSFALDIHVSINQSVSCRYVHCYLIFVLNILVLFVTAIEVFIPSTFEVYSLFRNNVCVYVNFFPSKISREQLDLGF